MEGIKGGIMGSAHGRSPAVSNVSYAAVSTERGGEERGGETELYGKGPEEILPWILFRGNAEGK